MKNNAETSVQIYKWPPENMRHVLIVHFNFSDFNCISFKNYLSKSENLPFLRKISSADKYKYNNKKKPNKYKYKKLY